MRSSVFALLVGSMLALPAVRAQAIGLPAGTQFQVVAEATYLDSEGVLYIADPASVTVAVQQVAKARHQDHLENSSRAAR